MSFRFRSYGRSELERAGSEFIGAFAKYLAEEVGTQPWTEAVLDWWANAAASKRLVDARVRRPSVAPLLGERQVPRVTHGEFLFDLVHSTWQLYGNDWGTEKYWKKALGRRKRLRPEILLALESEWGKRKGPARNLDSVMVDAAKLLHVQARAKLVLFASVDGPNRGAILGLLRKLISADQSGAHWLLIDMPWDARDPERWVLPER